MARRVRGRSDRKRRPRRALRVVERALLGAVMGAVAFAAERLLVRALKRGGKKAERPREAQLATASHEVGDQPHR